MSIAYTNGTAKIPTIIKSIVSALIVNQDFEWILEYPSSIGLLADTAIISSTTTFGEKFYTQIW